MDYRSKDLSAQRHIAFTVDAGDNMGDGIVEYCARAEVNVYLARRQQHQHRSGLKRSGWNVVRLPAQHHLPDYQYIKDTLKIFRRKDGKIVIVLARMKRPERQPEVDYIEREIRRIFPRVPVIRICGPDSTLEFGDVLEFEGRRVAIGLSSRTNQAGANELCRIIEPFDYESRSAPIDEENRLHLDMCAGEFAENHALYHPDSVDPWMFKKLGVIPVRTPPGEDESPSLIYLNNGLGPHAVLSSGWNETAELIESYGTKALVNNLSEYHKTQAGASCLASLLF